MSIFKAYDIRGLVPEQLDESLALNIGRAFGVFLKKGPIAVGHDMRDTSPGLTKALITGIQETGLGVVKVGLCSTPMLNFSVARLGFAGGIMVTASHNPGGYNGFKLCREQGIPISGDTGILDLESWVQREALSFRATEPIGSVSEVDIRETYSAFLRTQVKPGPRTLKIAVDGGNGMIGYHEYGFLQSVYPETTGLYLEPDGSFPNHEANPLIESNLDDLRKFVLTEKADIGVAFDGDGDRVVFLDEKGRTVMADLALALLASRYLQDHPGSPILYDLRSSRVVPEEIEANGGKPVISRVGHAFIKKTLREVDGILGGELSGHFYFKDFYFLDSGILGALKIIELLSNSDKSLSELTRSLDRYPRTGEINFKVGDADAVLKTIEGSLEDQGKTSHLDGFSFESPNYWFNVRKSNTEPLVRLNLQALNPEVLRERLDWIESLIGGVRSDH